MNSDTLYVQWLDTCLKNGIEAISKDTAARLMAIIYEYGNNEGFVLNHKVQAEIKYIQTRWGLMAMHIPEPHFLERFRKHVRDLQAWQRDHKNDRVEKANPYNAVAPDWVPRMLKERYNIKFIG